MPDLDVRIGRVALPLAVLLALISGPTPARCGAMPWTAQHFPSGGGFNHTIAVGDLNGDGRPDVAVANSAASAVRVLLGQAGGTLAPFQSYAVFGEPQDVQMADVTGDGIPDLATPDYAGSGVTVLRGLGDGGFAARTAYPAGPGLVSLAVADLDGDGRRDIAVSKEAGSKLAVLPALAGGGFGAVIETASGATPHQLGAADFDRDSNLDLAVASFGAAAVSVHLGDGSHTPGPATAFSAGAAPVGLGIADLDRDGNADLLVSNVDAATLTVLLGHGDGTFAAGLVYPTASRPRGMDAGDLDGDGWPDVVVATGYPDGDSVLTVYRGLGGGALEFESDIELPYRAVDCVIADMDGDGWRDIVATGPFAGVLSVLRNPAGTVGAPSPPDRDAALELRVHEVPARGPVTFRFRSSAPEAPVLEVFDVLGRRLAGLAHAPEGNGWHRATWRDEHTPPGIYLARLSSGGATVTRRVVLLAR